MKNIANNLQVVLQKIPEHVQVVAVTKFQTIDDIKLLYEAKQMVFGENRVQELLSKKDELPNDVEWHLIGHLQKNKVKYIVPFISLIHSVDNEKLLAEIDKEAKKCNRTINYLLQIHVAQEETKFGFSIDEIEDFFATKAYQKYANCCLQGIMGMASNTTDTAIITAEFLSLKSIFEKHKNVPLKTLSMGMSSDFELAINCGSNMIRVGSLLFK